MEEEVKKIMNTRQLYRALWGNKVTKPFFDGVYARDTLEDIQNKPQLIICNTHSSWKVGEHWLLFFFRPGKKPAEFFDSMGEPLESYGVEFVNFISRFSVHFKNTTKRYQPINSSLCGVYCLFYAYWCCRGLSMCKILKKMKDRHFVIRFVCKKFHLSKQKCPCNFLQMCVEK